MVAKHTAVAQDRLERRGDGKLELTFKKPWRDGTRALVLEPDDLIARLVAAVPPPRFHTLRYFGVLSSHSSRRALVVPGAAPDPASTKPPPAAGDQLDLLDRLGERDDKPPARKRWAWLLAHIFAADVETCPECAGPMRWAEVATSRADITRLLHEQDPWESPTGPVGDSAASRAALVMQHASSESRFVEANPRNVSASRILRPKGTPLGAPGFA